MDANQFMAASGAAPETNPLKSLRAVLNAKMAADSAANSESSDTKAKTSEYAPQKPGTDLASLMKHTINNSPHLQELASHPDFPALAQDSGVQSLVAALTNQVGKVLTGIKGSGHNPTVTSGD